MDSGLWIEVRGPFRIGRRRHRWRVYLAGGPYTSFVAGCWTRRGAEAAAEQTRVDLSNMPEYPPVVSRVAVDQPKED